MTHRENGLTPWIRSKAQGGPIYTVLPPTVYDAAVAEGCDMKWFIRQEPIPITPDPAHTTRRGNPKKHRDDRGCSGSCMLGLGGVCVACSEDDEA